MKPSLKLLGVVAVALTLVGVALWKYKHHMAVQKSAVAQASLPVKTNSPATASPPVPDRLRLAFNESVSFRDRVEALRALKSPLTAAERDAFYRYLHAPANHSPDAEGENWLRNEMLDKLVQQETPPQGLTDLLIAIYQDHDQDVVMRDYAVQHMAPAYGRASPDEQAKLRAAMWQATAETDTSIAGTALLALLDVVSSDGRARWPRSERGWPSAPSPSSAGVASAVPADDRTRLAQTALKLATDDHCGELARITAVQVCGRMQLEQAMPVIEQLAQQAESIPMRIAATAALGDMGTSEAANLLNHLAESSDARQALAAQSALRRLARTQITSAKQMGVLP